MKRLLFILASNAMAAAGFSQGVVMFMNYRMNTAPPIDAPISEADGTLLSGANPYFRAALVGGVAATGDPWGIMHRGNLARNARVSSPRSLQTSITRKRTAAQIAPASPRRARPS